MPKRQKKPTKTDNQKKDRSQKPQRRARLARIKIRRAKPEVPPRKLSGAFRLFMDSASLLRQHWKLFGGITLVYFLLSVVLVGALGGSFEIPELKKTYAEERGQFGASFALLGLLLSSGGSATTESGTVYQTLLIFIISLATIWSLRQVLAGTKVGVRDAFYKGIYPFIPFVLVLVFLGLLFIPGLIGSFILSVVLSGGLAVTIIEKILWGILVFLLLALTIYWISTFVFAVYIVTLPDMRPVAALKTARKLVRYRRWAVINRLVFLSLAIVVIGGTILLPLIIIVPVTVQVAFMLLSMIGLVFVHTYAYNMYKELL